MFFNLPFCIADLPRQINVSCRKDIVINQAVDGTFADHDGVHVVCTNMIQGLSFHNKRRNNRIKMPDFSK